MLPLLPEYRVDHYRFRGHLRIAMIMAMVAPACAFVLFRQIGWWNPWLWGCCGAGIALALCVHSVVLLHGRPPGMTRLSARLVQRSQDWFPYFFVVIQSLIASLIVMFIWFSTTSLALDVPTYLHAVLVCMALLIPARRLVKARITPDASPSWLVAEEVLHGVWHILTSVFMARVIISLTTSGGAESMAWQIMIWVPAWTYIVIKVIMTGYHLLHGQRQRPIGEHTATDTRKPEEPVDRF